MNLGSILGAIAGVVLIATGIGVVAGAMLLASSLASGGIIGGSIGKFMNSGLGRGLMAAVSLGSAAYAMYGASAAQAGAQAANQTVSQAATTSASQAAGSTIPTALADSQAAAMTNVSFTQAVGSGSEVAQMAADPAINAAATSGVSQMSINALNTGTVTAGGIAPGLPGAVGAPTTSQLGAEASQASAASTSAATQPLVNNSTPAGGSSPASAGTPPPGAAPGAGTPAAGAAPAAGAPASSGWGGTLMKALDTKGGSALIQGAGSMLGGIGNGIAQKQATEDALKAQQWGNMQWQNQSQVDNMQAAAARPITVPQGYLQRAQQVRSLMQGNQGMQPLPAASPGAPLAPSPVHI